MPWPSPARTLPFAPALGVVTERDASVWVPIAVSWVACAIMKFVPVIYHEASSLILAAQLAHSPQADARAYVQEASLRAIH